MAVLAPAFRSAFQAGAFQNNAFQVMGLVDRATDSAGDIITPAEWRKMERLKRIRKWQHERQERALFAKKSILDEIVARQFHKGTAGGEAAPSESHDPGQPAVRSGAKPSPDLGPSVLANYLAAQPPSSPALVTPSPRMQREQQSVLAELAAHTQSQQAAQQRAIAELMAF